MLGDNHVMSNQPKLLAFVIYAVNGDDKYLTFAKNHNRAKASFTQCALVTESVFTDIRAKRIPELDHFSKSYWEGVPYDDPKCALFKAWNALANTTK